MTENYTGLDVIDFDHRFVVNARTREITSKVPQKDILIQNDHNSERFTFEVPRFIEGRDLGQCNLVRVYYRNGNKTGVYRIADLKTYEFLNDTLVCSWLISQNATSIIGPLSFMLKFAQLNADNKIEYAWSTKTYDKVDIVGSIGNLDTPDYEYTVVDNET